MKIYLEPAEVLKLAREFMESNGEAYWEDFSRFKKLATDGGKWIDGYDKFINELLEILKL